MSRAAARCVFLVLLLSLASRSGSGADAGPSAPAEPPVLTLDQAVAFALTDNRLVASAELDVARAEDQTAAARTRRFPSLSLGILGSQLLAPFTFTFEQGVFGTYPGIGPIPATDTPIETPQQFVLIGGAQVSQPLSQLYRIGLNVRALKVGEQMAQEQLRSRRQAVTANVRTVYYGLLEAQSAVAAAREALAATREIERVIGERLQTGAVLEADRLEARARRARADADELAAAVALSAQKEQLNQLMGRDITTDFRPMPVPRPSLEESDLEAARRRALDRRPELRSARLQVTQAELDWRVERAKWVPDLSLSLQYMRFENFDPIVPKNFFSFGLLFQWEVFDWGRRSRQASEKEKTLRQAGLTSAETETSTLVEVGRLHRQLAQALRSAEAAELERAAMRERLRIARDHFEAGAIPAADLLQAEARMADADRRYQESVATFWTARADYERAVGEDR
jgi:outer membrane protein TolC